MRKITRVATSSSIVHGGKRIPGRMHQSGSALSKLVRTLAAEEFWRGEDNGYERLLGTKLELAVACQRTWVTLLIGPEPRLQAGIQDHQEIADQVEIGVWISPGWFKQRWIHSKPRNFR